MSESSQAGGAPAVTKGCLECGSSYRACFDPAVTLAQGVSLVRAQHSTASPLAALLPVRRVSIRVESCDDHTANQRFVEGLVGSNESITSELLEIALGWVPLGNVALAAW